MKRVLYFSKLKRTELCKLIRQHLEREKLLWPDSGCGRHVKRKKVKDIDNSLGNALADRREAIQQIFENNRASVQGLLDKYAGDECIR